jgi:hypothetical protein
MSSVIVEGNISGTGSVTIAAPNTNSDFTVTLPDNSGTLFTTGVTSGLNGSAITTGTVALEVGGTGQTTAQAAINALAGATTSGQYLRGNGTNVVMAAIQAGDVPTLNQNTTGTAANVTGTVAVANGGTGATTLTANNVILGNGTSAVQFVAPSTNGNVLTSNGTTWTSAAPAASGLSAASTAEAQAGTSNTVAITPLRMREGFNASGSAPVYACRAWVNYSGETNSIRASGNVSSITNVGTGEKTVNFATAMQDVDYCAVATSGNAGSGSGTVGSAITHYTVNGTYSTTAVQFRSVNINNTATNYRTTTVAIFR